MRYPCLLTVFIILTLSHGFAQDKFENANYMPDYQGPYFGQAPPGDGVSVFGAGLIPPDFSTHSSPAFSPDGKIVCWSAYKDHFSHQKIYLTRLVNGRWSSIIEASFSGDFIDSAPAFSLDGKTLYFTSRRPINGEIRPPQRFWSSEIVDKTLSAPIPLNLADDSEFLNAGLSVSNDGYFYFSANRSEGKGRADIYRARKTDSGFDALENLGNTVNSSHQDITPFIAVDGTYIIYSSINRDDGHGSADLYISFREVDGSWTPAKNLGGEVNSASMEAFPVISVDGQFLFFSSDRDGKDRMYWMETNKIDGLTNNSREN